MTTNAKQDAEIVALKAIVQDLGARLDHLEDKIGELTNSLDTNGGLLDEYGLKLLEANKRVDALEAATIDADGGRIERIETALDAFRRKYARDRGEHAGA